MTMTPRELSSGLINHELRFINEPFGFLGYSFFGIDYLVAFCKGRIFPGQACLG